MRGKFLHTCARCGGEEWLNRSGRYNEDDYLELFHEHMALQQQNKRLRALMAVLRAYMHIAKQAQRQVEESEHPF